MIRDAMRSIVIISSEVVIHVEGFIILQFGNVKVEDLTRHVLDLLPEFVKHWVPLNRISIGHGEAPTSASVPPQRLSPGLCQGEVVIAKDLAIDQFEHTKLIGHHITFTNDSLTVDVCFGAIIAQQE